MCNDFKRKASSKLNQVKNKKVQKFQNQNIFQVYKRLELIFCLMVAVLRVIMTAN